MGSNTNSPSTTRTGGNGGGMVSVITGANTKKSSPISSGGAGALLEGLERRMANKKDGATAVHVLLPEENDDDEDETSTTSSGDDEEVARGGGVGGPSAMESGSTNIVAVSAQDDEGDTVRTIPDSPYQRRPRPDNELTFLQGNLYPKEYGKTAFALALVLISAFANGLVIGYIHQQGDDRPPLKDIVFELVPYQKWAWTMADVMVTVCGVVALVVAIFHKHNTIVLRRTALLAAVLYFLRALFLLCTYLPPPFPDTDERCLPRWNISADPLQFIARAFGLVFTVGYSDNSDRILCGDTIYSGHTMIYVLAGMIVWNYCPNPWRPLIPLSMVVSVIFGIAAVIISRQHYTIDVVVALFVTVSMFYGYHVWCRQRRDRLACKGSVKSACKSLCCCGDVQTQQASGGRRKFRFRPVYAIFLYFERRVPHGPIPKELAWPFPWPSPMVTLFDNWNDYGTRGGIVTALTRSSSTASASQRRLQKRERKSSSSGGGSACGDSRHALTSSNSGLLNSNIGQQSQQVSSQPQPQRA